MRALSRITWLMALAACAQDVPILKTTRVYKAAGDLKIHADVYRSNDNTVRPAILWLHGGALIMGHRESISPRQLQMLINAGFAIVSIDYRLAPETKLPEILADVRDGYAWMRSAGARDFNLDPNWIGVVGHSAGGYLTLMCGAMLEPKPKVLVSFYGYGDIVGRWYSEPDPFYSKQPAVSRERAFAAVGSQPLAESDGPRGPFYLYARQNGLWPLLVGGRDPKIEPEAFVPWCPVRNVKKNYPPTMLLHGDKDTDVPVEQSVEMAEELKRYGVKHELVVIPGRGHGFDSMMRNPEIAQYYERAIAFLRAVYLPPRKSSP